MSVRKVTNSVKISTSKSPDATSYVLNKGDYLSIPHDIHMLDSTYFPDPRTFQPDRFLTTSVDGTTAAEMGTIRPYGGGSSMCKGRVLAERECLAAVAGILAMWDIESADKDGIWKIPEQIKMTAVSSPKTDTRVRVKKRRFAWDK